MLTLAEYNCAEARKEYTRAAARRFHAMGQTETAFLLIEAVACHGSLFYDPTGWQRWYTSVTGEEDDIPW